MPIKKTLGNLMKAKFLLLFTLLVLFSQPSSAQTEERSVDFTVSPGVIMGGNFQVALEWLSPHDFTKTDLSSFDNSKAHTLHPSNNHLIASKLAMISKRSFESLSAVNMNNSAFISEMLNSVAIQRKTSEVWTVTNKVKAYSIPFKVSFDLNLKEVSSAALGPRIVKYFKDEASGIKGMGRERFLVLDMTNFSQLMYRNYSIIYIKEISPNETMIVSGIVAAFDLNAANSLFNFPPFSTTKGTMMNNLRSQILHMAQTIQK
jgi:hypothetical protein